ncbi:MAG: CHRD domain-containing protein [Planctomycetota bacterium]|nr:CHRD domain-containing protein [Planctomycetota bacterium]
MTRTITAGLVLAAAVASASGQVVTLTAVLNGAQENPPVNTPATGTATLTIDRATRQFSIDLQFSGLTSPTRVAHIHRAPTGSNGPVIVGLDGINGAWAFIPVGVTSFNSNGPVASPFLFPAAELENLLSGRTYFNVHSINFPGGEIRGQIVPAPAGAALLGLGGLVAARRRRA